MNKWTSAVCQNKKKCFLPPELQLYIQKLDEFSLVSLYTLSFDWAIALISVAF